MTTGSRDDAVAAAAAFVGSRARISAESDVGQNARKLPQIRAK